MPIADFPVALQPIIQAGYLEHEFKAGLQAALAFRRCADRETVPVGIGQTLTSTRPALLPAVTTPINTAAVSTGVTATTTAYPNLQTAARLDNGLIPQAKQVEQYTLGIDKYAATMDLNTRTSRVALARQFPLNARLLGEQAARSLDAIARNALYATYATGNTYVRTASTTTAVPVDDIRGFLQTSVYGVMTPVTPGSPISIIIGAGIYSVTAATADGTNVSTTFGGVSGVLTLAAAVSSGDGVQYSPAVSAVAPSVLRPSRPHQHPVAGGDRQADDGGLAGRGGDPAQQRHADDRRPLRLRGGPSFAAPTFRGCGLPPAFPGRRRTKARRSRRA